MSSCALIDLHVHLDGSIPLSAAAQLAVGALHGRWVCARKVLRQHARAMPRVQPQRVGDGGGGTEIGLIKEI